jgi:putative copper export protein
MNPVIGIALMLNNYVHDVATGLLIISAVWLAWSAKDLGDSPSAELVAYFRRTYARCVRFVVWSIVVIVATGIIRTIYFMDFEWMPWLGRGLVQVLLLKHALIFTMLGAGGYAWWNIRARVRGLRASPES